MTTTAITAALHADNRERCVPPLPTDEVERIAFNVSLYPPGDDAVFMSLPPELLADGSEDFAFSEAMAAIGRLFAGNALYSPKALSAACDLVSKIPSGRHRVFAEATLAGRLEKTVGRQRADRLLRTFRPQGDRGGFVTNDEGSPVIRRLDAPDVAADQSFLVAGHVPTAAVGALVSDFSMGKSWLTIDLALSVAFGRSWFGQEVSQRSVIFLIAEGNQDFPARIFGWLVNHGFLENGASVEEMFSLLSGHVVINKVPIRFDDPDFERGLVATIEDTDAGLVVVDTLGKTLGRDQSENDNDVANEITGMLSSIAAETGCSTLFTHHVGHGDNGRARGASGLEQGLDFEYVIHGNRDEFDKGSSVSVKCRKMRSAPKPPPFSFRLKKLPGLEWIPSGSEDSTVVETAVVEPDTLAGRPTSLEVKIFCFVEENPGCTQGVLRTATARRRDDVNRAIADLEKEGAIENRGKRNGHRWHVVDGWCVGGSGEVENLLEFFTDDAALPTGPTAQS